MTVESRGDLTGRLGRSLKVGTPVRVEGPFGRFLRPRSKTPEIWIAGGIGITPFIAWAQAMDRRDGPAHLVYCARNEASEEEETHSFAHLRRVASVGTTHLFQMKVRSV